MKEGPTFHRSFKIRRYKVTLNANIHFNELKTLIYHEHCIVLLLLTLFGTRSKYFNEPLRRYLWYESIPIRPAYIIRGFTLQKLLENGSATSRHVRVLSASRTHCSVQLGRSKIFLLN